MSYFLLCHIICVSSFKLTLIRPGQFLVINFSWTADTSAGRIRVNTFVPWSCFNLLKWSLRDFLKPSYRVITVKQNKSVMCLLNQDNIQFSNMSPIIGKRNDHILDFYVIESESTFLRLFRTVYIQWDTENSDSRNSEFFSKIAIRIRKFRSRKKGLSENSESDLTSFLKIC